MNIATVKEQASAVLKTLRRQGLSDNMTAVLIGSCARGVANSRSDIDLLIVHKDERQLRVEHADDIHLQQYSRFKFLRKLAEGDDYPSWALRFGVPLHDSDGWWAKQVAMEAENPHWPDWRPKIAHAKKRLSIASELLEIGDLDAACEELMFAASHVARATLLKRGEFPLSRPELPAQLDQMMEQTLSQLLESLINAEMDAKAMTHGKLLLERQISDLTAVPILGGRSLVTASFN